MYRLRSKNIVSRIYRILVSVEAQNIFRAIKRWKEDRFINFLRCQSHLCFPLLTEIEVFMIRNMNFLKTRLIRYDLFYVRSSSLICFIFDLKILSINLRCRIWYKYMASLFIVYFAKIIFRKIHLLFTIVKTLTMTYNVIYIMRYDRYCTIFKNLCNKNNATIFKSRTSDFVI